MKIFLDFDGPILDNSEKYYQLHCDLCREFSLQPLAKETYWQGKRNKLSEATLLQQQTPPAEQVAGYERKRVELIETTRYLDYDRVWPGIIELLRQWQSAYELYLVTLRKNGGTLKSQLQQLALTGMFKQILSEDSNDGTWRVKDRLLSGLATPASECVIIGDTEADINAGKALGIKTVGVLSGIRTRGELEKLSPDLIIDNLRDPALKYILQ